MSTCFLVNIDSGRFCSVLKGHLSNTEYLEKLA